MRNGALLIAAAGAIAIGAASYMANASDHDDGVSDLKSQNTNLTDLYVFREDNQTGAAGDAGNLIFVMNTNPRSVPRQQYYFSTQARYEFHVTRVTDTDVTATGKDDMTLRFTFGDPDSTGHQPITLVVVKDGVEGAATSAGNTLNIAESTTDTSVTGNAVTVGGATLNVFAGLREDPFFFDVEQFFKVRGGTASAFLPTSQAIDFTAGYNVNALVVRVPITVLQSAASETSFDVWETISIPQVTYPGKV